MLRVIQISLLFIYAVLIPNLANADVVGGHDRQRLSLLFLGSLSSYVRTNPITLNAKQFPARLINQEQNKAKIALFDVLVDERLLEKTVLSANIGKEQLLISQVITYQRPQGLEYVSITVGRIVVQQITQLNKLPDDELEQTQYGVVFLWRFEDPAPWVWAPALETNQDLNRFKRAMTQSQEASAIFVWKNNQWHLNQSPSFLK